jgi:ATPase subunit of ABC transporter with duplicated ATPase domains
VEGRRDAKRLRHLHAELDWVRCGVKARQAKSGARLRRCEEMAAAATKTRRVDTDEIRIPPGPPLGNQVIEVDHLSKGDR